MSTDTERDEEWTIRDALSSVNELIALRLGERETEPPSCFTDDGLRNLRDLLRRLRTDPEPDGGRKRCIEGEHLPGDTSYGHTHRGGVRVRCKTCAAPLELHTDDGTYTEGWRLRPEERRNASTDRSGAGERYVYEGDDCTCPHGDPDGIGAWERTGAASDCPIHGRDALDHEEE